MGFENPFKKKVSKQDVMIGGAAIVGALTAVGVDAARDAEKELVMPKHAMPGAIASAPDVTPAFEGGTASKFDGGSDPMVVTLNAEAYTGPEKPVVTDHEELDATPAELAEEHVVVTPVEGPVHVVTLDEKQVIVTPEM